MSCKIFNFQDLSKMIQSSFIPHKIHALTGMRLILVLAVVFNHGKLFFTCWQHLDCQLNLSQAVSFFFVLSGFHLSFSQSKPLNWTNILSFYIKRLARIWPGHIFSLILLLILMPVEFPINAASIDTLIANVFLLHAWIPQARYFFSYNSPSWSMSTLLFFYFCFPFLTIAVRGRKPYVLLIFSAGLILALAAISHYLCLPDIANSEPCVKGLMYISPLTRILEFLAGMLTCELLKTRYNKWRPGLITATLLECSALWLFIACSANSNIWAYKIESVIIHELAVWLQYCGFSLLPIVFLVAIMSLESGLLSKFLRTKPMVLLGECSFAIYLIHAIPLIYLEINFPDSQSSSLSVSYLLITLIAAYLLHKEIEKPIRQFVRLQLERWLGRGGSGNLNSSSTLLAHPAPAYIAKANLWPVLQICLFGALTYFALPGLCRLPSEDMTLEQSCKQNTLRFEKNLRLKCARTLTSGSIAKVDLLWQSTSNQFANFNTAIEILDKNGKSVGRIKHSQTSRLEYLRKGDCWLDKCRIAIPADKELQPLRFMLTVYRGKRVPLRLSGPKSNNSPSESTVELLTLPSTL